MPRGIPNRKPEAAKPVPVVVAAPPPPPPVPPAPEPPSPVVLAFQEQILELVNRRGVFQAALIDLNKAMREIAAQVEYNRERIQQTEGEVQYRLQLIAQMQGRPTPQIVTGVDIFSDRPGEPVIHTAPYLTGMSQTGMGSIPAQRPPMAGVVGEVRSESAEDERRAM